MTTAPDDLRYPSHADFEKRDLAHPHRRVPAIPDFRFEWSYLRSIRPYVHIERLEPTARTTTDEKGKEIAGKTEEIATPQEMIRVDWARLLWITTRDQVLSPFAQGAAWGVAAFYLRPFFAALGSNIRAWWARGGTSDPKRRIEGHGVNWLRNWVSTVITTTPNVPNIVPK